MKKKKAEINDDIVLCTMCGSSANVLHKKCTVKGATGVRDIYKCETCGVLLSRFLCQDSTRMAIVLYDGVNFYKKTSVHLMDKWDFVSLSMFAARKDVE